MSSPLSTVTEVLKSNNGKLWIALGLIVFASILNIFGDPIFKGLSMVVGFVGGGIFIWDFIRLKRNGMNRPKWYTLAIYPWYVRKRGEANDNTSNDKILFKVAVVVFAFSILTGLIGTSTGHKSDLANAAQPVVSDIIHRYNGNVDCVKVYEVDKVADGLYRAKALLSNTNVCDISIKENTDDGTIYVTLLDN